MSRNAGPQINASAEPEKEKDPFADIYGKIAPYSVPGQYMDMEEKEKKILSLFYEECLIPYFKKYTNFEDLYLLSQTNPAVKQLVDSLVIKTPIPDLPPEIAQNIMNFMLGKNIAGMRDMVALKMTCRATSKCVLNVPLTPNEQIRLKKSLIKKYKSQAQAQDQAKAEKEAIEIIQM
jgi:hypothetical protein